WGGRGGESGGGEGRGRRGWGRPPGLGGGLPLGEQTGMTGREPSGALPTLGRPRIAREPVLHRGEQRRQRKPCVRGDRQIDGDQRLECVRPAADSVVVARERDHTRALVEEAYGSRLRVSDARPAC